MLFVGIFALSFSADAYTFTAGQRLYVEFDSNWTASGATFKIQFYEQGKDNSTAYISLTQVNGNIYECTIPSGNGRNYANITRHDSSGNNDWGHKYNIPAPDSSKNLLKISGQCNDSASYEWSSYTPAVADYDYWIKFYKNGSSDVWEKFNNNTVTVSASEVQGYDFGIVLADAGDASHVEKKWFASNDVNNKTVNTTGSTNFDLTESNPQNITMPSLNSGNFTFNLTVGSDKMPTNLSVTAPGGTTSDRKLYVYGNVKQAGVYSEKTDGILLTKNADGKYEAAVTFYKSSDGTNSYFRFWDEDNQKIWSCGWENSIPNFSSANNNIDITNYDKKGNWKVTPGSTYTVTLNADCQSFTISSGGGGGDDTDIPQSLYLRTNWNNWSDTGAYRMKWNATAKTFTCDFDYTSGGDFKFHFIEKRNSSWSDKGTVLYPDKNDTPISKDSPLPIPHVGTVTADPNTCWLYKTSTSEKIRVIVDFSGSQPTVRIVKYTETPKPHLAGNIYLMGTMLNDNVASPAWQMLPQGDGTYVIENFSMRFTENKGNDNNKDVTFGVCKFNDQGVKTYPLTLSYNQVKSLNVPTPEANGQQVRDYYVQPGWAYRAIYNENSNSLSFEPMDGGNFEPMKNVMPYIGILGTNFKQPVKRETRINFGTTMGNTDLGWQEAYIEYGPGGQPLFNAEGQAYYNTVWPPRENILMISDVGTGVDPIPVSSDRLTMKRYNNAERKTGQKWMDDLKAEDSDQYTNLVLEPGTTYVRFTAPNMWMLGEFKIWTGWSGEKVNWGALWDRHVYWGPAKGDDNNPQDGLSSLVTHKTLGTSFESLNYYTPKDKDGKYTRSYYRTLEIFIPLKDNGTAINFEGAKIYATEADGGAQIDALAKGMNAGYNPTLATKIPDGYRVKEYKITRYAFEANVPSTEYADKFLPVDRNRQGADKDGDARVAYGSPEEMATKNWTLTSQFNDFFKAKMNSTDAFEGKYIDDGQYAEGKYIYRLEVTFVDTEGGIKTKYADVWSPRVEIIDVNYNLNAYPRQLIKLKDEINGFNCITYNPSMNGKLVKLENVDGTEKITKVDNADLPVAETRKIYDETGQWTNLSAIVSTLPMQFIRQGVSREVTIYRATRDDATEPVEMHNIQGTNFYVALFHNATDIRKVDFNIEFQGEITLDDNKTFTAPPSPAVSSIEYTPTFPLPYLGTPKFEMVAHEDNAKWNDNHSFSDLHNWTFTHEHVNGGAPSNKNAIGHELQMTIPVHMPNISSAYTTELKDAVYSKLTDLKVKHNGTAHSVKVTDTSKTPAIVYRNQSPFDWLSPDDASENFWKADEHEYAMDGSYDGIDTYKPFAAAPVVAKLDPKFVKPSSTFQLYGELYGTEGEYFNPEDYNNFPHQRVIHARIYLKTLDHGVMTEGAGSSLNDVLPLEGGDKSVYVFHLRNNETSEDTKVDAGYIFNSEEKTFTAADNDKGMVIFEGANFYPQEGESGMDIANRIGDWMHDIEIEIGQAHMFYAKNENAQSGYVGGLSGETFPTVVKPESNVMSASATHESAGESTEHRRGSYGAESKLLKEHDDAYLFSPIYRYAKITDNDITTGIGEIITDEAIDAEPVYYNLQGVRVANPGKGLYIKVTGNRSEKVIL